MSISLERTDATHSEFKSLVALLDAGLKITDGEDHHFYHQFNGIESIKHVVLASDTSTHVGCGAIKHFDDEAMEVKRMYVRPEHRGGGIAVDILSELEAWARELGYEKCVLETGLRQTAAIRLYQKSGYEIIDNYGQYVGVEGSICFEKSLK